MNIDIGLQPSMSGDLQSQIIHIPDTLASWPWRRRINPHYDICKAESSAWCESFKAFDESAQKSFNKCNFNLLASLVYSSLDKDGCRIGCDLMNLFFVIDGYTDMATPDAARVQGDTIMDAIRNPHTQRPKGEWVGGEVARQFWENAVRRVTPTAQHRFVEAIQGGLNAIVEQAADRTTHNIRSIESYFHVRRETIGLNPSFALIEMYMNLPDYVFNHSVLKKLRELSIDLILISNDLHSYNKEQAEGDETHNLVTVVMHEFNMDIQNSINWISNLHMQLANQFVNEFNNIPAATAGLSERDRKDVYAYCNDLGYYVRGNDCFDFESERYFGTAGPQVQETRRFMLLKKQDS